MRQLVALAEAGLPVVVVNPRRVRSFGQAMGIPARTGSIDARLKKAEPRIRPILQRRARPWQISWLAAGSSSRRREEPPQLVCPDP